MTPMSIEKKRGKDSKILHLKSEQQKDQEMNTEGRKARKQEKHTKQNSSVTISHSFTILLFPPVSLWLFGAHVGVRRLLGDKDTANLAQLLVHLEGGAEWSLIHTYKQMQMDTSLQTGTLERTWQRWQKEN